MPPRHDGTLVCYGRDGTQTVFWLLHLTTGVMQGPVGIPGWYFTAGLDAGSHLAIKWQRPYGALLDFTAGTAVRFPHHAPEARHVFTLVPAAPDRLVMLVVQASCWTVELYDIR